MHAGILAIECAACNRRAALTKRDGLPIYQGNKDAIARRTFRCRCGSDQVRLYIPATEAEAAMWLAGDPLPAGREARDDRDPSDN